MAIQTIWHRLHRAAEIRRNLRAAAKKRRIDLDNQRYKERRVEEAQAAEKAKKAKKAKPPTNAQIEEMSELLNCGGKLTVKVIASGAAGTKDKKMVSGAAETKDLEFEIPGNLDKGALHLLAEILATRRSYNEVSGSDSEFWFTFKPARGDAFHFSAEGANFTSSPLFMMLPEPIREYALHGPSPLLPDVRAAEKVSITFCRAHLKEIVVTQSIPVQQRFADDIARVFEKGRKVNGSAVGSRADLDHYIFQLFPESCRASKVFVDREEFERLAPQVFAYLGAYMTCGPVRGRETKATAILTV